MLKGLDLAHFPTRLVLVDGKETHRESTRNWEQNRVETIYFRVSFQSMLNFFTFVTIRTKVSNFAMFILQRVVCLFIDSNVVPGDIKIYWSPSADTPNVDCLYFCKNSLLLGETNSLGCA